jgi:hypothetical protein
MEKVDDITLALFATTSKEPIVVRSMLKTTYNAGSQPPNIQVLSDSEGEIAPPMDKDTYDTILYLSYLALFFSGAFYQRVIHEHCLLLCG